MSHHEYLHNLDSVLISCSVKCYTYLDSKACGGLEYLRNAATTLPVEHPQTLTVNRVHQDPADSKTHKLLRPPKGV